MTTAKRSPDDDTVALIRDEVAGAVARQFEQNTHLNQRAQQLLGFGGLVLGVVLGLTRPAGQIDVAVLVSLAVALFVLLAVAAGLGWSLRGLRRDPLPAALWEHYRLAPAPWLSQLLVLNLIASTRPTPAYWQERSDTSDSRSGSSLPRCFT